MTEQAEHLLIISIGPVQDFIAAARRCQDLWFGSFLLSELAATLAQKLASQGATLIFPGSRLEAEDKVAVANKVVAKLPSGLEPHSAVDRAQDEMRDWLDTLAEHAFARCEDVVKCVTKEGEKLFLRHTAQQQVADLIDLQWVAVPMAGSYADAHANAERLLAWRKNTRNFQSVPWEAGSVPKSSIDGHRESVIGEEFFDRIKDKVQLGSKYRLGINERLCGVGILKRYGSEIIENPQSDKEKSLPITVRPVFHSNSHVAAGPLFARIKAKGEAGKQALDTYLKELVRLQLRIERFKVRPKRWDSPRDSPSPDGYLFYPERLPEVFKEESLVPLEARKQQDAVRAAQAALQRFFEQLDCSQSEAYYVMLSADGDHMGAAIRALAGQKDAIENHRALSEALARFAERASVIVEALHAGSLIYSGGDDVLALLPLHTALSCARALSKEFVAILHPACPGLERKPTLSVGLAVAHHMESMGRARQLANDAEKLAKRQRNALAIVVDKRSGGTISVNGRWEEDQTPAPAQTPLYQRIQKWIDLLHSNRLPDGVAFELLEVLAPFEVPSPGQAAQHTPREELTSLVKRVCGRKRSQRGQEELSEDVRKLLESRVAADIEDPLAAVRSLSCELQIAREFLRARQLAEGGRLQ